MSKVLLNAFEKLAGTLDDTPKGVVTAELHNLDISNRIERICKKHSTDNMLEALMLEGYPDEELEALAQSMVVYIESLKKHGRL